jgi:hypothetical protein
MSIEGCLTWMCLENMNDVIMLTGDAQRRPIFRSFQYGITVKQHYIVMSQSRPMEFTAIVPA